MRKYLLCILPLLATILGGQICNAQISVGSIEEDFVKITGKVYYTVDGIYTKGGNYYLVVTTDNRFDEPQYFQIGTNKQETIKSLQSILSLYDTLGADSKTEIVDPNGMKCIVYKQKGIGSFLDLYFKDCAGKGQLGKKVLSTYIKIVDKQKE